LLLSSEDNCFVTLILLIRQPFQSEALDDGGGALWWDDVAVVAGAEGEPYKFDEVNGDRSQSRSPQNDAEAEADAERAEV
jgi:hypothetical protein